jgi:hypothetical protein
VLAIVLGVLFGLLFISALLTDDSIINVLAIVLGVLCIIANTLIIESSVNNAEIKSRPYNTPSTIANTLIIIVLGVLCGLLFISALLTDDSIINVLAIVLGVLCGLLFISALLTDDSIINVLAIVLGV